MSEYTTMKEIGKPLGLTSHEVGKRLKELGMRTSDGKPSWTAFQNKLVEQLWEGENYLWGWHAEKTTNILTQ